MGALKIGVVVIVFSKIEKIEHYTPSSRIFFVASPTAKLCKKVPIRRKELTK